MRGGDLRSETVKILVEGDRKTGKSDFILSVLLFFAELKFKPEQVLLYIFDWDNNGIVPLITRGRVPPAWRDSIYYVKIDNIFQLYDEWKIALPILEAHAEEYGVHTTWIALENMGAMWERVRDDFSKDVYGDAMHERLLKARKKAAGRGNTKSPEFHRRDDYAVMNPLHNNVRNEIVSGRFNTIITAHLKDLYGETADGKIDVIGKIAEGQKGNDRFVDIILRKYIRKVGKDDVFSASLRGCRYTKSRVKDIDNPDFKTLWTIIYKIMTKEMKEVGLKPDKFWLNLTPDTKTRAAEPVVKAEASTTLKSAVTPKKAAPRKKKTVETEGDFEW